MFDLTLVELIQRGLTVYITWQSQFVSGGCYVSMLVTEVHEKKKSKSALLCSTDFEVVENDCYVPPCNS